MKIVTWNINGIRTFKDGIKKTLDSFNADIICVQETKVTRDLLDERTAIVDGYNSYFSFSRGRSGYSGVATFCKDTATPFTAEEGLTGRLVNHAESVGCCNDVGEFTSEELQALDSEGRAVITQHRIKLAEKSETLTVINVYCPRADPEKPERKLFKLQFYKLLQTRAETILGSQSHVIILGDINTSHRPIDHCDADDVDNFEDNPGRKWLDDLLCESNQDGEAQDSERSPNCVSGGQFVDSFRYFHPTRTDAFTCWSSRTGARQTNYGTRIDYIFADRSLAKKSFLDADIMPEVEGSDHCPMWAQLSCSLKPSPRCPALCTRYLPEFIGKQQKLLRFLVKVSDQKINPNGTEKPLPGSQEDGEVRENLRPQLSGVSSGQKRPANGIPESSNGKGKKNKQDKKTAPKPQGSLLNFFKPKLSHVTSGQGSTVFTDNGSSSKDSMSEVYEDTQNTFTDGTSTVTIPTECHIEVKSEINNLNIKNTTKMNQDQTTGNATINKQTAKASCPDFWKSVLHGPPQPPLCKGHNEPCVLRTVKKAGPNMGRQFFVCCRPEGHASNPDARCNFFAWVDKRK